MTEERKKLIQEGLKALLEEKIGDIEKIITNEGNLTREVDDYLDVYRVAKKELPNAEEYMTRVYSMTTKFSERKNRK